MNGLTFSNELISRDEGLHTDFAVLLYSMLEHRLTEAEITVIMREAVDIEQRFITDSIPCDMIGMNKTSMCTYIEYVADRLMLQLEYRPIYGSPNPFDFMELISIDGKTNFFERRVGEYAKAKVGGVDEDRHFGLTDDF